MTPVASKNIGPASATSQKTPEPKKPVPAKQEQAKPPGGGPNPSKDNSSKPKQPNLPPSDPSQPSSAISKTKSTGNPKTNPTSAKPHIRSPKANSFIPPKSNGQDPPKPKALDLKNKATHASVTVLPKKPELWAIQENSQGKALISAKPNQQRRGKNKQTCTETTVVTTKVMKWTKTKTIISNGQQTITSVSEGTQSTQKEKQSIRNCPGVPNLSGIKKLNKPR